MRRTGVWFLAAAVSSVLLSAGEAEAPAFKSEKGTQAFEAAKAAFQAKNVRETRKHLSVAAREAANAAAKEAVRSYQRGLKGLQDLLVLEGRKKTHGGWAYQNAQREYLYYYTTPVRPLFEAFLRELESPERKLVTKVETFERGGPYSVRYGKTFVHRAQAPQFVLEGQRSLKWECKGRDCLRLKIPGAPKNWKPYSYLGFWLYEERGKNSSLYVFVVNATAGKKRKRVQRSFNGYQAKLAPHTGWKFIVLSLEGGKGFRRVGKGDLSNVGYLQIQLPGVKPFLVYVDNVVLVRKN